MAASSYVLLGVVCHLSNCHWHEWEWSVPVNWVEQFEWTNGNEWLLCDVFIKDEWPTVLLYELKKKVFNVTSLYSNSSKAIQYLYVNDWLESINVSNNIGFCMWWSLTKTLFLGEMILDYIHKAIEFEHDNCIRNTPSCTKGRGLWDWL